MPLVETRETARICRVDWGKEDHGINTFCFMMEWRGGGQGFGMIALDEKLEMDLKKEFIDIFGTYNPLNYEVETIKYSIDGHSFGEHIEGLIYKGKRFELNEWRKKHFPETKSLLEQKIEYQERHIGYLRRDLERAHDKLRELKAL